MGIVEGLELVETHWVVVLEEGMFLQDNLTLRDSPGGEDSPPLARRLPDGDRWAGRLVGLPIIGLAFLGTVGNLLTDTVLQLPLRNLTEAARGHLRLYCLKHEKYKYDLVGR